MLERESEPDEPALCDRCWKATRCATGFEVARRRAAASPTSAWGQRSQTKKRSRVEVRLTWPVRNLKASCMPSRVPELRMAHYLVRYRQPSSPDMGAETVAASATIPLHRPMSSTKFRNGDLAAAPVIVFTSLASPSGFGRAARLVPVFVRCARDNHRNPSSALIVSLARLTKAGRGPASLPDSAKAHPLPPSRTPDKDIRTSRRARTACRRASRYPFRTSRRGMSA